MNQTLIDLFLKLLTPPGNGVYTVHTAKEYKQQLHQRLYGVIDEQKVLNQWKNSLQKSLSHDIPLLLGIPSDTGGGIQRGANWGPLFVRNALLDFNQNRSHFDLGDIRVIPHLLHDKYLNEATIKKCQDSLFQGENLPVSPLSIAEKVYHKLLLHNSNFKIVAIGGDHSISYPIVKQWLNQKKLQKKRAAIIHFDAHTDLLSQRLGIDICFGSWAYHMIELLDTPKDLIQIGIRSSGKDKTHWESTLGVQQFWANEILTEPNKVNKKIISYLKENQIQEVYISFDIDALDAEYASATGTAEINGLAPHYCIQLIEEIAMTTKVTGADIVEVAPFVRSPAQSKLSPEPDTTLNTSALILNCLIEAMK